jgi:hypothetical protein
MQTPWSREREGNVGTKYRLVDIVRRAQIIFNVARGAGKVGDGG